MSAVEESSKGSRPRAVPEQRPPRAQQLAGQLRLGSALCALLASALLARAAFQEAPAPSLGELTGGSGPPGWGQVVTYAPSEPPLPQAGEDTSEQGSPLQGFALVLESEPSGALVLVNGKSRGETPSSLTPECEPGEPLKIEFSLRGYERALHETRCREDTLLRVLARLRRSPRGSSRGAGR